MLITPDKFEIINQEFFESLIQNGIEENLHLDYKEKVDLNNAEIAKDISSFANKDGGNIIYGIKEFNQKPTKITPIQEKGVRERIDQIALNGIDPSLNIRIKPVDVDVDGVKGQIFVISIPKKYPRIHQAKKRKKYYQRTEFTTSAMSNSEIELAFNLAHESNEKFKKFRDDRIFKIKKNRTYILLQNSSKIIILLIPMSSADPSINLNLEPYISDPYKIDPINCSLGRFVKRNINGLLCTCGQTKKNIISYVQVYRNGIIESVDNDLIKPTLIEDQEFEILYLDYIEREIITAVQNYVNVLKDLNVGLPIQISLFIVNVKGYYIDLTRFKKLLFLRLSKSSLIEREDITLPDVIIDTYDVNVEKILKPGFDIVWNACGQKESLNYDDHGNFIH